MDGTVFPLQMTVAMTHNLKYSGAANAKNYFDGMYKRDKPTKYPAVFVVPLESCAAYKTQKFVGAGEQDINGLAPCFEQWVVGL